MTAIGDLCDLSLLNLIYKLIYLILIYIESIPALLYIYGAINVMFYSILGILNGYKVKKKKNRMILKCWGFFFFKFNIYAQYDFKNDHDKKKKIVRGSVQFCMNILYFVWK